MHWRNQFKNRMHSNNNHSIPYTNIQSISSPQIISFKNNLALEEDVQPITKVFPEKIIIQAHINLSFYQDEYIFIVDEEKNKKFFPYKAKTGVEKKSISEITLNYDVLLSNFDQEHLMHDVIPDTLFQKKFDVMCSGQNQSAEIRSPQNFVPGQSLWSYGAIYTPDFDACQLVQYDFFPLIIDNTLGARFVKRASASSVLDDVTAGKICIYPFENNQHLYYASIFMKQINNNKVHLYFKKYTLTNGE